MSPLQSRQKFSLGISALAATAIIGFAVFKSRKKMKLLFSPLFSYIRRIKTQLLLKPASVKVINNSQQCSKYMKLILR